MTEIRVEVPNAMSGFILFQRIGEAANVRVRDDNQWEVLISSNDETEHLLDQIRALIRAEQRSEVVVHVDGKRRTLSAS